MSSYSDKNRFGVSRVYSQQCGYVLSDTQAIRDKMLRAIALLSTMKDRGLDPNAGKARSVRSLR